MAAVILVFGAVLVGCGLVALWSGIAYMPVEWGWSQIIAGTTASTGGLVIVALAAVVHRLRAIETAMLRTARAEAVALAPDRIEAEHTADLEAAESTGVDTEPVPAGRSAPADPPSILVTPLPEQEQPRDAQETSDVGHRVGIGDVTALGQVEPDLEDAGAAPPVRTPVLAGGEAVERELADGDATTRHGERHVVGRYESGGASYALFSDGTIEVESETGTHRFGSMDELKAHVERQTRAPHAEDWPD